MKTEPGGMSDAEMTTGLPGKGLGPFWVACVPYVETKSVSIIRTTLQLKCS